MVNFNQIKLPLLYLLRKKNLSSSIIWRAGDSVWMPLSHLYPPPPPSTPSPPSPGNNTLKKIHNLIILPVTFPNVEGQVSVCVMWMQVRKTMYVAALHIINVEETCGLCQRLQKASLTCVGDNNRRITLDKHYMTNCLRPIPFIRNNTDYYNGCVSAM